MNLDNMFSTETWNKMKKDISYFLRNRYNIDTSDPEFKRILDERVFQIFKIILAVLFFKK